MPIPFFTSGYPPDGSSLGNTKAVIRDNLDGEFQVFSVDHVNQNLAGPGAHLKCSLKEISGSLPLSPFGAGYETLYSKITSSPTEGNVFFLRGGEGAGIQLTGPGTPTISGFNGFTFLPGGILYQWGIFAPAFTGDNTIGYPTTFPNAVFNISLTTDTSNANVVTVLKTGSANQTNFIAIVSVIVPVAPVAIFWTAIGN